jgi:hypothetical protein
MSLEKTFILKNAGIPEYYLGRNVESLKNNEKISN